MSYILNNKNSLTLNVNEYVYLIKITNIKSMIIIIYDL